MLAVSDNGTGMDAETQARIFEPFFTTKEQGKGTGLGLATVYGIVKQSSGYISVYSEPGMGSTFKVYMPLVDDAATAEGERVEVQVAPRGTETVLLVEDSDGVRSVARRVLERQGYMVMETASALDALVMARRRDLRIHLLLTDVVMPQMSGRVLAEKFAEIHPKSKVLYMSGYTDDAIVRHGVLSAGVAYLQKPFSPIGLAQKVREVLDTGTA
jgi:CheY-like chemotaxis protein